MAAGWFLMQEDLLVSKGSAAVDGVRAGTPAAVNQRIDQRTMQRVWGYARKPPEEITRRIQELDNEWDVERVLEAQTAAVSLAGVVLSGVFRRRWLLLPAGSLGLLLQHSLMKNSLAAQLLRRVGIRTRREIDAEKYALRLLRGDFDRIREVDEESHRAIEALRVARVQP